MRLILFFLIISSLKSFSTNYYVSAKKGSNAFDGLTPMEPKRSIQDAANLTKPGDTVFVMNGTYKNDCASCNVVEVPNSGTEQSYIVYINYPGHRPVVSFNGWGGFSIRDGVSYIKIIGFEVVGNNSRVNLSKALKQPRGCSNKRGEYDPRFNGNGIAVDGRSGKHPHHIVIAQNKVRDCGGGGIGATQADYITVEDNIVYNNSWYTLFGTSGISFYQFWNYDNASGYHNFIRRNKCYNNKNLVPWFELCEITDGNGIIIDDFRNKQNGSKLGKYNGRTLIENNICWYNGGTGIHTYLSDHVDVVNNTAYHNSQSKELNSGQILANGSSDIKIINNILVSDLNNIINSEYQNANVVYRNNFHYNSTYPERKDAIVSHSSCVTGLNPLFIDPLKSLQANFNLQSGSPAIDQGSMEIFSQKDFGNKYRVGIPDIGAYEHHFEKTSRKPTTTRSYFFKWFIAFSWWFWLVLLW